MVPGGGIQEPDASVDVDGDVDLPDVLAEVRAVFERYERALLANDVATLDQLFWASPRVVRFGFDDRQHGAAAVSAHRRAVARQTPPRSLRDTLITTFGTIAAVVTTEFVVAGTNEVGRQSQTWVRRPEGWRVVSAHVSRPMQQFGNEADHDGSRGRSSADTARP
jgi:hypothetical protein